MGLHVILCVVLIMLVNKSEQTCTQLEVLGMTPTQKEMKVNENSLFNLTVRLHKSYCPEKWNWSLVKLSIYDNGKQFDVCKIIVSNLTCKSPGSSHCVCLHEGFVQFTKWVTQQDSQIFIWKWSDSYSLSNEKIREIILFVERQKEEKTVSLTFLLTTTVSCVGFVIIVIITAICVVRHKRHTGVTTVRTSVPPTRVQGEEIHMYTALYPQRHRHPEQTQTRVQSSKEMTESVGPRTPAAAQENQPDHLELTDHHDDYLEPVPIL